MKTNDAARTDAKSGRCRVCGGSAVYMYFGTLACQACKMFFKRYGNNQQKVSQCSFHGQCEINLHTRHLCTACRLKKCLASGMQAERIRRSSCANPTKVERKKNLSSSRHFRSSESKATKTLSFIASNSLSLTSTQHCLLNNLTHAYDFSNIETNFNRFNQIDPLKDVSLIRPIHPTVTQELLTILYQTAAVIWKRNQDFQTLNCLDRSLLLSTAINNTESFLATYIFAQHNLYHNPFFVNHLLQLYGPSFVKCHHWTTSIAQLDDPVLFKLFLALFALSRAGRPSRPNLRQEFGKPRSILDIEHRYTEVMWKYLVNKYDHGEAVRRLMKMMRWLLATSVLVYQSHGVERHMDDIEEVVEEVEMSMIMNEMDELIDGNI